MTPLQRIAMGLLIVIIPANFPAHPEPEWAFYDALPAPLGWALVLACLYRAHTQLVPTNLLEVSQARRLLRVPTILAWICAVVSVPLWFPQLNHHLTPAFNPDVGETWQWFFSQPPLLFGFLLAAAMVRIAGKARPQATDAAAQSRLRWMELVFLALAWGFLGAIVLPPIALGAEVEWLLTPMLVIIGASQLGLVIALLWHHRSLYSMLTV